MVLVLAAALLVPAAAAHESLDISVAPAPIGPGGTTAGEVTDFVLTFIDRNPAVDGIGMVAGGSVTVELPPEFTNTGSGGDGLILLQGWPQSPPAPPPAFPWTTAVDGTTVSATLTADFLVGAFGPGVKQVHLLLNGFRNPTNPGVYDVGLTIRPDPDSTVTHSGVARVKIVPRTRPSINIVSVFSGPPGPPPPFFNPLFQDVEPGDSSRNVGMYLWGAGSSVAEGVFDPMIGVDVVMQSDRRGALVQDGRVVGHVAVRAPRGARHLTLTSLGPSTLGNAAVTGFETGVLIVALTTDPHATGTYTVTFRLNGGNSQSFEVTAR